MKKKSDWIKASLWELISLLITFMFGSLFLGMQQLTIFVIVLTLIKIPILVIYNYVIARW